MFRSLTGFRIRRWCRRGEILRSAKLFYQLELRIPQKSRVTTKSQLSSQDDFVIGFEAMADGVLESTSSMFLTIKRDRIARQLSQVQSISTEKLSSAKDPYTSDYPPSGAASWELITNKLRAASFHLQAVTLNLKRKRHRCEERKRAEQP